MSFELKDGTKHSEAVVTYRKPKSTSFIKVVLGKATQAQLEYLFKVLKHPFVIEKKTK